MTAGEVIRELEAAGVHLWLDGERVRWRRGSRVPRSLLAAAGDHRDAIRVYLARCCKGCNASRPVMLLMDELGAPWWVCARCFRGDAEPINLRPNSAGSRRDA